MAKKMVQAGGEYELLGTKSLASKIFLIFTLVWVFLITAPLSWIVFRNAPAVQRYVIVFAVSEVSGMVIDQTTALEERLLRVADVNRVVGRIPSPSIDTSGIMSAVERANYQTSRLTRNVEASGASITAQTSALVRQIESVNASIERIRAAAGIVRITVPAAVNFDGVLGVAQDINNATGALTSSVNEQMRDVSSSVTDVRDQANRANEQMQSALEDAARALATDFNDQIRQEIEGVGARNMQRALNLSDASFALLKAGDYGILTAEGRANTLQIYSEFKQSTTPVIRHIMRVVQAYWMWISIALTLVFAVVMLAPIVIAAKIKKAFTDYFDRCPNCGKVFIAKRAKMNILKLFKFW